MQQCRETKKPTSQKLGTHADNSFKKKHEQRSGQE